MDVKATEEQLAIEAAVRGILGRHRSDAVARMPQPANQDLMIALHEGGYLDLVADASSIEANLVTELAAASNAPVAARALVGPLVAHNDYPLNLALCDSPAGGVVRYGADLDALLIIDGDHAAIADRDDCEIETLSSRYGYPFARVRPRKTSRLDTGGGTRLRAAWQLALGAELSGNMVDSLILTSKFVAERHQFGRPIGSFQAIQHRLATAYVMAEGARWLTRRASATPDDEYLTACAAAYACEAADNVYTATHQTSGAIGLTTEQGLVTHSMRLIALRRELGGQRAHARRVVAARPMSPNATPRLTKTVAPHLREQALNRLSPPAPSRAD